MSNLKALTEQAAELLAAPTQSNLLALRGLAVQLADEHNAAAAAARGRLNGAGLTAAQLHSEAARLWLHLGLASTPADCLAAATEALAASTAATGYAQPRNTFASFLARILGRA